MILFISNSWSCFFAKSLLYPHLEARYFSFSFNFSHTEIEKGGYSIYIMEWKSKSSYFWRGSLWLFSSNGYREQKKFMRIETEKKKVLVLRQWPDLYQFSKVSRRTNPLKLVKSGQFFCPCKLSNSRLRNNNEIFLIELITRPCKYELSVRTEVVLNEAIFHQSSS